MLPIESLRVFHARKANGDLSGMVAPAGMVFGIETCQRKVWVTTQELADYEELPVASHARLYAGTEGYEFLVRFASGLESDVPGETEVFGQFKEAWKKFEKEGSELACFLHAVIQKVYEDTKEVRSRFLQNLGSASYGSLVRRVLKDQMTGPILIVGAGQIAQSVAPWLTDVELMIWNRSDENLFNLESEIRARVPFATVGRVAKDQELDAWKRAAHVIVCVPVDQARDAERIAAWNEGVLEGLNKGYVVHLGGMRAECSHWDGLAQNENGSSAFVALNELFQQMREQGDIRSAHIVQAEQACREKARLRALGGVYSHGWEDLAVFA